MVALKIALENGGSLRHIGTYAIVDAKWALTLGALVEELDPRVAAPAGTSTRDHSARLPDTTPTTVSRNNTRHVCPEVYYGRSYDHPFHQHGMEPEKCTSVSPFGDVVTAVLPALSWPPPTTHFVISHIRKHYNIPIIVLASKKLSTDIKLYNVSVVYPKKSKSEASSLNYIMKLVKTPYVFMGTSLAHFSNQSSLERLVRVLDDIAHVAVAAGAARDLQGRWTHGCMQQHMANYHASYTMGYYYSKYECMYCDDVLTPFVTSAKLVKKVAFTGGLNGPAIYRDWFVKVREEGHLIMVCPDVMFFLTNHVTMASKDWLPVARRWVLQKVLSYTGESFNFTCKNINISCNNILAITKSFLLPPCCIKMAVTQLNMVIDVSEKNGLEYELQSGSALGAVKFGSYLPWDTDHDIYIECKDFNIWYRKLGPVARAKNCTQKIKYKNVFLKIVCPSFTLDIYCRERLSRMFLPDEYVDTPTSVWYSGRWAKVVANPGLFSRNYIGFEDLKHQQHSTHWKGSVGSVHAGSWLPCSSPQHHSCLDRFPADGSIPFV
ncbi:uncharacterized protein [Procambarus clarkii]|uniref:uncharacterized protein n=1 Tax=Procambarus clarkii TaxID=6728 RepID=UPI003742B458